MSARTTADGERPWAFFLPLWSTGQYVAPQDPLSPLADVHVVRANRVYVEQKNQTPSVRCKLIGLASFNNLEFYRSTRREDVLLQKNGYRVLRLLVEDVCTDLDSVLNAIQGCYMYK